MSRSAVKTFATSLAARARGDRVRVVVGNLCDGVARSRENDAGHDDARADDRRRRGRANA